MDSPELFSSLLKFASALAVTIGVMILTAWLFRKIMRRGGGEINDRELIRILSSLYLGPKSSIMLVDVLGRVIVVGITSGTISLLTEIMDPESLEHLKDARVKKEGAASFSNYLKGL
jgi:flagellar protein FliO/FliZ